MYRSLVITSKIHIFKQRMLLWHHIMWFQWHWIATSCVVAAVSSSRHIMVVFSLISSYDSFGVRWSSLNMLPHIASCTSAFVITPVCRNLASDKLKTFENQNTQNIINQTGCWIVARLKERVGWVQIYIDKVKSAYLRKQLAKKHHKMKALASRREQNKATFPICISSSLGRVLFFYAHQQSNHIWKDVAWLKNKIWIPKL